MLPTIIRMLRKLCVLLKISTFRFTISTQVPNTIVPDAQKNIVRPSLFAKFISSEYTQKNARISDCHAPKKNQVQNISVLKSLPMKKQQKLMNY